MPLPLTLVQFFLCFLLNSEEPTAFTLAGQSTLEREEQVRLTGLSARRSDWQGWVNYRVSVERRPGFERLKRSICRFLAENQPHQEDTTLIRVWVYYRHRGRHIDIYNAATASSTDWERQIDDVHGVYFWSRWDGQETGSIVLYNAVDGERYKVEKRPTAAFNHRLDCRP